MRQGVREDVRLSTGYVMVKGGRPRCKSEPMAGVIAARALP